MALPLRRALLFAVLLCSGCSRPELTLGEGCERNSDCESPLVCEIGRCRKQCLESRDCAAGLFCLAVEDVVGGVCQLPEDTSCALNSDCIGALVCQSGTCQTECADDRDCAGAAICMAAPEGQLACIEAQPELCIYNSDCPDGLVCTRERACREECIEDRDCGFPRVCDQALHTCILDRCGSSGECEAGRLCVMDFCQPEPVAGSRS